MNEKSDVGLKNKVGKGLLLNNRDSYYKLNYDCLQHPRSSEEPDAKLSQLMTPRKTQRCFPIITITPLYRLLINTDGSFSMYAIACVVVVQGVVLCLYSPSNTRKKGGGCLTGLIQ